MQCHWKSAMRRKFAKKIGGGSEAQEEEIIQECKTAQRLTSERREECVGVKEA